MAAEVAVPEGRQLDRVELYWNQRLLATLFQPPFRHRLQVPEGGEGYLRAVAWLADGSRAEDAMFLGGEVPAERLDVALTELYVVVTDRRGRPVQGLAREDFTVREDGDRQRVESFGDASELPLTVGVALDSSASMFVKLPAVREAAFGLLDGLVPGRDQAFLVDFDDEARLVVGPTTDFDRVRRAAATLSPGGRTSLWQAVVFSLVELQSSPGRRALVVYSDGADQDEEFSFRTCVAFARRVGVPIYVIVANDEAARVGSLSFGLPSFGSRLDRLTGATGGRSWIVRRGDDLGAIYQQIRDELAAQYRLGYYPEDASEDGRWRDVGVEVRGSGLTARTVSGYRR
jgi:Ca-activated chloride channel family protein